MKHKYKIGAVINSKGHSATGVTPATVIDIKLNLNPGDWIKKMIKPDDLPILYWTKGLPGTIDPDHIYKLYPHEITLYKD
jgi:hypothetical protein